MLDLRLIKLNFELFEYNDSCIYSIDNLSQNQVCFTGKTQFIIDKVNVEQVNNGYIVTREIYNNSNKTLKLKELCAQINDLSFDEESSDDYYYSVENLRLFGNITLPIDFDRLNQKNIDNCREIISDIKYADNGAITNRINNCPYMPFPAILISNYNGNNGIVVGSLSQDVFYNNFELSHINNKITLKIYSSFKGVDFRELKASETLVDKWYIGLTDKADDINHIFDGYNAELKKYTSNYRGKKNINRHTLIWDSWNDGIYRNVSEDMLLNEAKAVKKYFPNVEWFQLDDGYASFSEKNVDLGAHGLGVIYEGEDGIDHKKFPNGLKSYTDKIKEIGLRPAIWVGAFCPTESKIYKEQRDWFVDFSYRCETSQPLDVSKEEVRKYMAHAIKTFLVDYGFEGIKHDFWSYVFEDYKDLLKYKDKSGYEYREWWQKQITSHLSNTGYVEIACDIGMGNPFLGKYFNNYRFGFDIGSGEWWKIITTYFWAIGWISAHCGDLFVPNCDSIGLLPGLNDTDFMFVINFAIITRSLVEISGRFSKVDINNKRLKILQKATEYLNNGEDVFFANFDYRKNGKNLPKIIYLKSIFNKDANEKNTRTVALFNGEEKTIIEKINVLDLDLPFEKYFFENVWTGETFYTSELCIELEPHESKLFVVNQIEQ